MSHADNRAVDIDRLADYAAGALDRAAAAEVSHLIATRPTWADAYLALVAADATTRAELRNYARSHLEPMPADVIARLDAAFGRTAVVEGRVAAISSSRVTRLEEARRRKRFVSFATAAAAAVIVIAGFAVVGGLVQPSSNLGGSATNADRGNSEYGPNQGGAGGGPAPSAPAAVGSPLVFASGTDYRPDTLDDLLTVGSRAPQAIAGTARPGGETKGAVPPQADDLGKLSVLLEGGASLQACLGAVTRSQPGAVAVIDFAQYEGRPALVMLIRDGAGGSGVVVVVGPNCGRTDADVRVIQRLP